MQVLVSFSVLIAVIGIFVYLSQFRTFSLADEKDMRRLFRGFFGAYFDYESSRYECWGADGGPGLYGRTFYVKGDTREVAGRIAEYLVSKGFTGCVSYKFANPCVVSNAYEPAWLEISPRQ